MQYVIGDATNPIGDGHKVICHVCNDVGGWGRGFVLALSAKWSAPEANYRRWSTSHDFGLGQIQVVNVEPEITIVNMVAQRDIRSQGGIPPIRYEALRECLSRVWIEARRLQASVHMPRIGAGLAGGDWAIIETIINDELSDLSVFVYDLPK